MDISKFEPKNNEGLKLNHIDIKPEYRKEWQINPSLNDFVCLTKDGVLLRNTLYRVGGLGKPDFASTNKYFMILKHVEAFYSEEIIKMSSGDKNRSRKHLESHWCIIDREGNERLVLEQFKSPYLVKNSCIYSIDRSYYNIETGYCYGSTTSSALESEEYLFLDNSYDKDKEKRGVLKILKSDGSFELFKK